MKFYPILLDVSVLNTADSDELDNKIANSYKQQYNNLEEVRLDECTLQYVKEQTPEICREAVQQNAFLQYYM